MDPEPASEVCDLRRPAGSSRQPATKAARRTIVSAWASKSSSCDPRCLDAEHVEVAVERVGDRRTGLVGRRPNFDPVVAVRIASCVSASTPSVTRTRTRPTPAAAASSASSDVSRTTGAPIDAALRRKPRLVVAVDDEVSCPGPAASANASSPSEATSAPMPSSNNAEQRHAWERLRPEEDAAVVDCLPEGAGIRADCLLAEDEEQCPMLLGEARRAEPADP